jgi:hypothetical protein
MADFCHYIISGEIMKRYFAALLLVFAPTICFAWGKDGHSIVGAIAEANLTPQARAQVQSLLKDDLNNKGQLSGRKTLAEIASWADEIRSTAEGGGTDKWHYRNNPVCKSQDGPCEGGACVDAAIKEMVGVLQNKDAPTQKRNEALKWIVHRIQDYFLVSRGLG